MAGINVIRDILRWMADPKETRDPIRETRGGTPSAPSASTSFSSIPRPKRTCRPGSRLGDGQGRWGEVWTRFSEAPSAFPGVAEVLGTDAAPAGTLQFDRERWPDLNDEDEACRCGDVPGQVFPKLSQRQCLQ